MGTLRWVGGNEVMNGLGLGIGWIDIGAIRNKFRQEGLIMEWRDMFERMIEEMKMGIKTWRRKLVEVGK